MSFIEDDVMRYVDATGGHIMAFYAFVLSTIPNKNTLLGTKHEPVSVIGTKVGSTGATKNTKSGVIWCDMENTFSGSFM